MISVVLATHNEEKNLTRCLTAIKKLADEIIVVDGESSDQTAAIAKKFDAKVYHTSNKLNFHINKQMAMDKAKGDLVLQLDADEVVDPELAEFINKTHEQVLLNKKSAATNSYTESAPAAFKKLPKAWWIKRKNLFLNRWLTKGGQYPDPVIRLYINGYAKLPQKDVHEQMQVAGKVAWAKGHLLHYSNPQFTDYLRKFNHYTNLKAEQLKHAAVKINVQNSFKYCCVKPISTFCSLFFRHKGFMDGIPGFVFALFSAIYHCLSYLKLWEKYQKSSKI